VPPKRKKVDPIRNPPLFPMEKLGQESNLSDTSKVEKPYCEPGLYLGTSSFTA
jgi:hypothetical protein